MYLNLEKLINNYKIETNEVAYIGANQGQNIPILLKILKNPIIHLFEPQKKVFEKLKNNYSYNENLRFYNIALGSKTENKDIYVNINNSNQSSSILEPAEHKKYHKKIIFDGRESIKVDKFSNLKLSNVNFLNIDVQGYELEVLKGCDEYLKKIKYIICEVNRKEMYKDCVLVKDLDKYLKRYSFIRVETAWCEGTIPWGDALYLKKTDLSRFRIIKCTSINYIQNIKGYFFFKAIPKRFKKFLKQK